MWVCRLLSVFYFFFHFFVEDSLFYLTTDEVINYHNRICSNRLHCEHFQAHTNNGWNSSENTFNEHWQHEWHVIIFCQLHLLLKWFLLLKAFNLTFTQFQLKKNIEYIYFLLTKRFSAVRFFFLVNPPYNNSEECCHPKCNFTKCANTKWLLCV